MDLSAAPIKGLKNADLPRSLSDGSRPLSFFGETGGLPNV